MTNGKHKEEKLPRVLPSEMYPIVEEEAEKLKAVVPVFGKELVETIINAIKTDQIKKGELELVNTNPSQTIKVVFENTQGSKKLKILLKGDWEKNTEIPLGNPLNSPVKGIVYRKRQPQDKEPIVKIGKSLAPGDAICAISQTKNNIWYLYLPAAEFPQGGILTKFVIPDGGEVEKNQTICYVQKI